MDGTAQKSRPIFDATAPADPTDDGHVVYHGRVISVGDRVITTTYTGEYGDHTELRGVPEIWIVSPVGKELRFCAEVFRDCRAGHDVVIVGHRKENRILAVRNVSKGGVTYSAAMNDVVALGAVGTACVIVFFCCIGWFVSMLIFGDGRTDDSFIHKAGRIVTFWGAVYLGWSLPKRFRRRYNAKAEADRRHVLALLG